MLIISRSTFYRIGMMVLWTRNSNYRMLYSFIVMVKTWLILSRNIRSVPNKNFIKNIYVRSNGSTLYSRIFFSNVFEIIWVDSRTEPIASYMTIIRHSKPDMYYKMINRFRLVESFQENKYKNCFPMGIYHIFPEFDKILEKMNYIFYK